MLKDKSIAIVGLGYVGLPLAIEFSKFFKVLGYDIDPRRIADLVQGIDKTQESNCEEILSSRNLKFSTNSEELRGCNVFIVTVPTPIDQYKSPNLEPLISASRTIGKVVKKDDLIIYESTVYPGCTEEICVPILEYESQLKFNEDFFCGYSPERINPGDKINTLTQIKKVTSGSTYETAIIVDEIYKTIIKAGTHLAPSIKVAEASKAIENAQRDINISFVNELALIFDKIGIDTKDVLDAAATKWNFLAYVPGLVGGHCIGVDPYYLAHKAESLGYYPQVILSGRRVNDNMGIFVANKALKLLIQSGIAILDANALILGVTFKENCPDIRNLKVIDIYNELSQFGLHVDVFDNRADPVEVQKEYGITLVKSLKKYDLVILAVAHSEHLKLNFLDLKKSCNSIIYDIKSVLDKKIVNGRL